MKACIPDHQILEKKKKEADQPPLTIGFAKHFQYSAKDGEKMKIAVDQQGGISWDWDEADFPPQSSIIYLKKEFEQYYQAQKHIPNNMLLFLKGQKLFLVKKYDVVILDPVIMLVQSESWSQLINSEDGVFGFKLKHPFTHEELVPKDIRTRCDIKDDSNLSHELYLGFDHEGWFRPFYALNDIFVPFIPNQINV